MSFVVAAGTGHQRVDTLLDDAVSRRILLRVPHFVAVGHILKDTNMIATVPERFALRCVEPFALTYVPHPVKLPEMQRGACVPGLQTACYAALITLASVSLNSRMSGFDPHIPKTGRLERELPRLIGSAPSS